MYELDKQILKWRREEPRIVKKKDRTEVGNIFYVETYYKIIIKRICFGSGINIQSNKKNGERINLLIFDK